MMEAVFFNVWSTRSPDDQQTLIAAMRAEAPALATKPGFRSLTAWAGQAGDLRVIVEGRWQSVRAFEAAVARDAAAWESRARLERHGRAEPGMFAMALHVLPEDDAHGEAGR
jgi:heme-degrading monooxygenase HmoA